MKIDLHVHTKKCKKGDAHTREITPLQFRDIILATEVRITAITNHNVFDIDQFIAINEAVEGKVQVWPGVEFDIEEDGKRGHLLVIVSPKKSEEFASIIDLITKNEVPDSFSISIEEVVKRFDLLGPLYIAHYKQKKPDISEIALDKLLANTANKSRVIKEVTNAISAGIYIAHGHPSIYGSDVQDWAQYEKKSIELPDLRLPVESFEHFCLLLEKDATTINTLLDKKTNEVVELRPFEDKSEVVALKIYNDINVFFGAKGTGKSRILAAIAKHFVDKGIDASPFETGNSLLKEQYNLAGKGFAINLEPFGINYCTDEISEIRNAKEVNVTGLGHYVTYFNAEHRNQNAKKILLKELEPEAESGPKRKFEDYEKSFSKVQEFLEFLSESEPVKDVLNPEQLDELRNSLSSLFEGLSNGRWEEFIKWKETFFFNNAIKIIKHEVAKKAGIPTKPLTTGFSNYALNRINIEVCATEVVTNIKKPIKEDVQYVGNLGEHKGELECRTKVLIQNGNITDSTLSTVAAVKKGAPKTFVRAIQKILSKTYDSDLFKVIAELKQDDVKEIKTINELLLFKKYFALNGEEYAPSNGESSMLMLQKELGSDKEIYILDEPEKSLGNDYISDVIVPLIKEKARAGKKIFISTHDANIAVRTLPYSSIFRRHGLHGYETFAGNPFSNFLVNIRDNTDKLDWKKISMKTLEGGEEAFGERGRIYGHT